MGACSMAVLTSVHNIMIQQQRSESPRMAVIVAGVMLTHSLWVEIGRAGQALSPATKRLYSCILGIEGLMYCYHP